MATLFPFPSSKAWVRAVSSANWTEVPEAKGLVSMVSKLETTSNPASFFYLRQSCFHWCTRFPQDWSKGLLYNPFQDFVQWSKVSRQEWKGRDFSGLGMRVAGLRTSKKEIVLDFPSALLDIWDIHKWPFPFRSCFTWWLVKIVSLPPKESFKASSIMVAIAERFWRQGDQPQVVGSSLLDK